MKNSNARHFLETGEGFTTTYNFHVLAQYLTLIPEAAVNSDPLIPNLVAKHMNKAKGIILNELPKLNTARENLELNIGEGIDEIVFPEPTDANWFEVKQAIFLFEKMKKLLELSLSERRAILENQRCLITAMLPLVDYLIANPKPIYVKISRLLSPADRTVYSCSRKYTQRLAVVRRKFNEIFLFVQLVPPPFRSEKMNRIFFNELIDEGLSSKAVGSPYFPELQKEYLFYVFLTLPQSPIVKEEIYPLSEDFDFEDPDNLRSWIDQATIILAEFAQTEDQERAQIIAVMVERFIFSKQPSLWPSLEADDKILKAMSMYRGQTPRELKIKESFIPDGYMDRSVDELLHYDELLEAPLGWLLEAELRPCPADAAYCLARAHESISLAAVLRDAGATRASDVPDFMNRMPGFDDIFALWLAMLCSSDLSSPRALSEHLDRFSRMPGIGGRMSAGIPYLEAAVAHLCDNQ